MKKYNVILLITALTVLLGIGVYAEYPSSKRSVPAGSVLLDGTIIGEEIGWGDNANAGCAAAFDGDVYTYYDPTQAAQEYCYCGVEMKEAYILTIAWLHPRDGQLTRYAGGMIQGSNDMKKWNTLWKSEHSADDFTWYSATDFKNNTGYKYYRYFNEENHGDIAELELYGYAGGLAGELSAENSLYLGELIVSFDANGGRGNLSPIKVTFGEAYPEFSGVPTYDGYSFGGWSAYKIGGSKISAGDRVTIPESHILYARWLTDEQYAAESQAEVMAAVEAAAADKSEQAATENAIDKSGGNVTVKVLCIALSVISIAASSVYIVSKRKVKAA